MIALLALLGCHTAWEESELRGLRLLTLSTETAANGQVYVDIPIEEGDTRFLISSRAADGALTFIWEAYGPGGMRVFSAEEQWASETHRANAAFADVTVAMTWPLDGNAEPLRKGFYGVDIRSDPPGPVDLAVVIKQDDDLSEGTLNVDLLLAGDLSENQDLQRALDGALDHWTRHIYRPAGIELLTERFSVDTSSDLSRPGDADGAVYEALAAEKLLDHVNLVLVDQIRGVEGVLGVAGNIPGPLVPTPISAVTISVLESAGGDGRFSDDEITLFAETMAHEVGHYLGLFHPVELPEGDGAVTSWDALGDTTKCGDFEECTARLGGNLMFPAPVCQDFGPLSCRDYLSQIELTAEQRVLANGYPAID